jgi:hypothetical protein
MMPLAPFLCYTGEQTAPLRHVTGFSRLGLLRGLRGRAGFSRAFTIAGSSQRSGLGHPRLGQSEPSTSCCRI